MHKISYLILLVFLLFSCSQKEKKSKVKEVQKLGTSKDNASKIETNSILIDTIARIQETYSYYDSVEVILFKEESFKDFIAYDHVFKVLADSTKFHSEYRSLIEENIFHGFKKIGNPITQDLKNTYSSIWIPVILKDKNKYLYNPGLENIEYFIISDTAIYYNSFSSSFSKFDFEKQKDSLAKHSSFKINENLELQDRAINLYTLDSNLNLIEFVDQKLEGNGTKNGYMLATTLDNLFRYPIIATYSSDAPIKIQMDKVNYDSLINKSTKKD
ncbi:hypothetical protein [Marivirga arenosa]|uniref:Lipoprotein n=1 Tax=Marivirga arenosa TaxID=3059076 RepID=A0AA51ZW03_9BACT|nr:hypothetical protein [Marivirga sp. BKB1-2]WNB17764.1 hypothetical protein QYS47_34900 [Marivirga sp. BKB1-2]